VVLLSGTGRPTDLPWALGAGALAVLPRPVSSDQLEQVLRKAGMLPGSAA
jgi:CheY-like chemotaxis protein